MISLKEFIKNTQGKVVGFTDSNKHKGECVTLIQEYLRLCYGIPFKPRGNAHEWLKNLPKEGLAKVVNTPRYGDIIIWGTDVAKGYGHLAIYIDKNKYYDQYVGKSAGSESRTTSKKPIGYLRMNKALIPDKTLKPLDEIAADVRAGKYKDFPERKALLEAEGYNYREVQDRVNELIEQEKQKSTIKVGDKVKVLNAVQYNNKPFKLYYNTYDVIEVKGDRVVIGKGNTVTAAINIKNIRKV